MIKTTYSTVLVLFAISVLSLSSFAAPGDLFVTVQLDEGSDQVGCSILKVDPQGNLSIFITEEEVREATGLDESDCENVGIACDSNGEIYFSEDFSPDDPDVSRILKGGPTAGIVSLFTPNSAIIAATGEEDSDPDHGLTFGPDGNLYAADDSSDSVLRITVPGSQVSLTVIEEQIEILTGEDAELDGGIAIDPDFNIYVVDSVSDNVFVCRPGGPCSILTTEDELEDAAGVDDVELNEDILLVGDQLYIAEDTDIPDACDCVFVINVLTGTPEVFLSEDQLESVLGTNADPEGGLAVDSLGRIYVANNDGSPSASIVRTGPNANVNQLSLFVDRFDVVALYSENDSVEFEGGICIASTELTTEIPTLSEWSMIAMAGVLGLIGLFFVMRRRALSS